jgi:hypothetical protein
MAGLQHSKIIIQKRVKSGKILPYIRSIDFRERGSFKAVSPGLLPPLGIIFGLFVALTAAQVWNDNERANTAVSREASALRAVVLLAASFPGQPQAQLRALLRGYIEQTATQEWTMMAHIAT